MNISNAYIILLLLINYKNQRIKPFLIYKYPLLLCRSKDPLQRQKSIKKLELLEKSLKPDLETLLELVVKVMNFIIISRQLRILNLFLYRS